MRAARRIFSVIFALAPLLRADTEGRLTFHEAPRPLAAGAVTEDWPRFLGPRHNATSAETKLLRAWPKDGPRRVWELEKGEGWACPAVAGEWLVMFHRRGDREVIDTVSAETGKPGRRTQYAAEYQDRYGAGPGPRTSPVIAAGRVFTWGVTARLHALALGGVGVVWQRYLPRDFEISPNFFGSGSTPLVVGNRLIINLGGKDNVSVLTLDAATGKRLWIAKHEWGASYASPIPATIHGRECVLVFAGGESHPPTGGLLTIDAATGKVLNATPHRAEVAESVNASSPVFCPPNLVFVSESYGAGGAMIEIGRDFSATVIWRAPKFGTYFMTPVVRDGFLYGFDGQSSRLAELVCYEVATGREMWRDDLGGKFGKGSLLFADGMFLCLGEFGDLLALELSPRGATTLQRAKLFHAPESWTLPALSRGLLYVCQNARSEDGSAPRIICYDLRGE